MEGGSGGRGGIYLWMKTSYVQSQGRKVRIWNMSICKQVVSTQKFSICTYLHLSFLISLPPHWLSGLSLFLYFPSQIATKLSLPLFKVSNFPSSLLPLPSICCYLLIPEAINSLIISPLEIYNRRCSVSLKQKFWFHWTKSTRVACMGLMLSNQVF